MLPTSSFYFSCHKRFMRLHYTVYTYADESIKLLSTWSRSFIMKKTSHQNLHFCFPHFFVFFVLQYRLVLTWSDGQWLASCLWANPPGTIQVPVAATRWVLLMSVTAHWWKLDGYIQSNVYSWWDTEPIIPTSAICAWFWWLCLLCMHTQHSP